MSCFLVDDACIHTLVRANADSVAARYPTSYKSMLGKNSVDACVAWYVFEKPATQATVEEIVREAKCFRYQSCETEDWEGSVVHGLVESLLAHYGHEVAA